jgi:hypothetical protein
MPLGGGVNGCTDEAMTDDQDKDDEGLSYVIPAKLCAIFYFHYETSSSCHQDYSQERSLEQIPLNTRRKSWKSFQCPI